VALVRKGDQGTNRFVNFFQYSVGGVPVVGSDIFPDVVAGRLYGVRRGVGALRLAQGKIRLSPA